MSRRMKKIALVSNKGGVGKTSNVVGIADALAVKYPEIKILIMDCDDSSNIKTVFGMKYKRVHGGLASVLLDGINPKHVITEVRPQIDVLLSGGRATRDIEKEFRRPDSELFMHRRLQDLEGLYDVVLLDTPPSLNNIHANIAAYADYWIIPCTADLTAFVGVKNTLTFLEAHVEAFKKKEIRPSKVLGTILNMYDERKNLDCDYRDDLEELEAHNLLQGGHVFSPIRSDVKVRSAQKKRKLLSEIAPNCRAVEDYERLVREMEEHIHEPFFGDKVLDKPAPEHSVLRPEDGRPREDSATLS